MNHKNIILKIKIVTRINTINILSHFKVNKLELHFELYILKKDDIKFSVTNFSVYRIGNRD